MKRPILGLCIVAGALSLALELHADPKSKKQQDATTPTQAQPQDKAKDPKKPVSSTSQAGSTADQPGGALDKVLRTMDENAAKFRSAQADFTWTPYNSVINETESPDRGRIYFRRSGKEIQMAADLQPPDDRQIIFTGGKIQVFQPKTKVVDVYDASSHRDEVEGFLVLGFGSSGADLRKSFNVKYLGEEKIGNVQTAKLELIPLSEKIKSNFPRIDLWIDPERGLSLRQQLFQAGGDYRLADYFNIRLNEKVPDSAFKLKSSGQTKTVNH